MPAFTVTFFEHVNSKYKEQQQVTLESLAEIIDYARDYKEQLRLVKCAEFGDFPSTKGILRHDANVRCITGVEIDYDAGEIAFEIARERLHEAGITGLLYTTPSHKDDAPRWRFLAPCSNKYTPDMREKFAARINGVLGGIAAHESFTLSQAFFIGHLNGHSYQIEIIPGDCIDQRADLDEGAIGRSHTRTNGGGFGEPEHIDKQAIIDEMVSGKTFHTNIGRLAGPMFANGQTLDDVVSFFAAIVGVANQERYQGRWNECVEFLRWIYEKEQSKKKPQAPFAWIKISDWDLSDPPAQEWAVVDVIPLREVCLFSGEGAAGKSTLGELLACSHPMGRAWLNFDSAPGPAFFIDAEDDPSVIWRRGAAVCDLFDCSFTDLEKAGLYIKSLAGCDAVMAALNRRSGLIEPTALYQQILEQAGDIKPKNIIIASAANVYAGSEIDRSQVTQFVGLLTKICKITNGSVTLISHPSLTGITNDSGISGSTQWHNAVRSRMWLRGVKNGEAPDSDVRQLDFKKNQYGKVQDPITLRWKNGLYLPEASGASYEKMARDSAVEHVALTLVKRFWAGGRTASPHKSSAYAPKQFAEQDEAKMAKASSEELRRALDRLFAGKKIRVETGARGTQTYAPCATDSSAD